MSEVVFIGVPYWLGKKDDYTGSVEIVQASDVVRDSGAKWVDIQPDYAAVDDPVIAVNRALAAAIQAYPEHIPVIIAGDCTSCLGAMKGLEKQSPLVVWYDAHGDFNTPETTPSGFLGGMPLAALTGRGNQTLMDGLGLSPIADGNVVVTDVRDLDPEEGEMLRDSDVAIYQDVADLKDASLPDKPVYLHFDTDVIHTDDMPAVSYPAAGGPTVTETIESVRAVIQSSDMAGVLFTVWNNNLPGAETARESTLQVLKSVVQELSR